MTRSVPVLGWENTTGMANIASVDADSSIDNEWLISLMGTSSTGSRVKATNLIADNTGNNGVAYIDFGYMRFSIPPYTRKTFSLGDNQVYLTGQVTVGILALTFSDVDLGIPDEVNQYATGSTSGGSVVITTFSPSDKSGSISLTNSNLTENASAINTGVRSIASKTAGKFYFETSRPSGEYARIGLANAAASLVAQAGENINSIAYNPDTDQVRYNAATQATFSGAVLMKIAVDFTNSRIWFAQQGSTNWNGTSGDPASNVGGINIAALIATGPLFIFVTNAAATNSVTLNTGGSPMNDAVPSGFSTGW